MVSEERDRSRGPGEVDHPGARRPPVDQVAEEDHPVAGRGLDEFKQVREFIVAAVDVANGYEASGHLVRRVALRRKFGSVAATTK